MHRTIEPTTLYFGTPVALISTLNPDGSPNLAPMSSAWRPLMMSFCRFFGLGGEVHPSRLADSAFMKAVTGVAPARA